MGTRPLTRGRVLLLAGAALLTALAAIAAGSRTAPDKAAAATAAAQARPNIVVIETDDQTVEQLRFMPNVKQLIADQGVTFDNSFVSYSLCCPSRSTFLTGQYAHNHGVMGNSPPSGGYTKLNHQNTLAVWLQRGGYHTVMVGKYLNGYGANGTEHDVPPGWSEWYGATKLPFLGFTINENGQLRTYPADQANYQTDVFAGLAVDAIRRNAGSDTPLFVWLTPHAPHSGPPADPDDRGTGAFRGPYVAAKYRNALSGQGLPQPPSFNELDVSDKPAAIRNRRLLNANQTARATEMYQQEGESLLSVDDAVRSVVDALRAGDELDRTLLVFTDDNGFMHGEHRIPSGKVVVYEPSIRVPLVMRGPGIPHGRHVADEVMNVDLAPTILDAANVTAGLTTDGRSLLPLAADRLADYGRDTLLETPQYSAIRTDRYKYVEYRTGERELYDLKADPYELQSRHNDPALARVRAELARRLATLRACNGASCRRGPRLTFAVTRVRKRLRLRVSGLDAAWVSATRFYVNGKLTTTDARAPFTKLILRARLGPAKVATLRVHVTTSDGRGVTLVRRLRVRR